MSDLPGRVLVYSVSGCPFCIQAKSTLRKQNLSYHEVTVDEFPDIRRWLAEKTGKTSVPQIFFNNLHIGGNAELQSALKNETRWAELLKLLQESDFDKDELLVPTEEDIGNTEVGVQFQCERDPIADLVEELMGSGILHTHRVSLLHTKSNSFAGEKFVKWFCEANAKDEEAALAAGTELLQKKFILAIQPTTEAFKNDANEYYRINDCSNTSSLNSGSDQNCIIEDVGELGETLRKLILKLYDHFITEDGKGVDYQKLKESSGFQEYVKVSQQLQRVAIEQLDDDARKAFFINIYNALVIHATASNGSPSNWFARLRFYQNSTYIIGGEIYSLNDVENGVLRGNKRGVLQMFLPFSETDPRLKISLPQVDPRIHFALNCGAKSCPPIKTFSAENIDEELEVATASYLESDEGVQVDVTQGKVGLSSLLKWYRSDFGSSTKEVLQWVTDHITQSTKKQDLQTLVDSNSWKLFYLSYDWSSNSNNNDD